MQLRHVLLCGGAAGILVMCAAVAPRPATADDNAAAYETADTQQQRQPTMCEAVALRAQTLIEANLPLPRNMRGKAGPAVNMACEAVRQHGLR